ncbi:MAG: argininosuccinate synthase domain-containing protein [Eggerthellaceae bacterium]
MEKGFDVIAVCGNVSQDESLAAIKQKAIDMGAVASFAVDMREEHANEYVTLAIAANGLYENFLSASFRAVSPASFQAHG